MVDRLGLGGGFDGVGWGRTSSFDAFDGLLRDGLVGILERLFGRVDGRLAAGYRSAEETRLLREGLTEHGEVVSGLGLGG